MKVANWKDIPCYEGVYQASDTGLVRSVDRIVTSITGRSYFVRGRVLKPFTGKKNKYLEVQLSVNGISKKYLVHRLVASIFIGTIKQDMEVNHKDGNVKNNYVSNLEIVTHQQNIDHSIYSGLKNDYGELHKNAKLTNSQAEEIRHRVANGEMQKDLSIEFGVCRQTICNIVHRNSYFK